ncbi:uncharacterized protein F5147DRAFT_554241, partial [Suillus discolor]
AVICTTPPGLPIIQPYRTTKLQQLMTAIQNVFLPDPNAPAEVRQCSRSFFSLDTTYTYDGPFCTAIRCLQGLAFASMHDSYSTHASNIEILSKIIPDTFIALHFSDVL